LQIAADSEIEARSALVNINDRGSSARSLKEESGEAAGWIAAAVV
jgi:hypothetical protein